MAGPASAAGGRVRLLRDENLPQDLGHTLTGHDVQTAAYAGFGGLENGQLLRAAADAGFDALLTMDAGIEFEQGEPPLSVVVIRARSNKLDDLLPIVPRLLAALELARPRTLVRVE